MKQGAHEGGRGGREEEAADAAGAMSACAGGSASVVGVVEATWAPHLSHACLAPRWPWEPPRGLCLPGDQGWGGGQLEGRPIAGVGVRVSTRAH